MNLKHLCILLILIIASSAVAGCCCCSAGGSPAATPTEKPTVLPTAQPGTDTGKTTPTAQAPTQGATVKPSVLPAAQPGSVTAKPTPQAPFEPKTTTELFDVTRAKSVEYLLGEGTASEATLRMENLGKTTYNGFEVFHITWNSTYMADGKRITALIDVYQHAVNRTIMGGRTKIFMNGQFFMEQEMTPVTLEHTRLPTSGMTSNQLAEVGTEQVTVGGKTYDCTKYSATDSDGTSYYWVSPEVPFPVKYQMSTDEGTFTSELTDWS